MIDPPFSMAENVDKLEDEFYYCSIMEISLGCQNGRSLDN